MTLEQSKERMSKSSESKSREKCKSKERSKETLKLSKAQEKIRRERSKEKVKPEKEKRWKREKPLDKNVALYAARADKGAKKGQARRKNYFQALDQYQTTVAGGGTTTVGGATAINDREDDDFAAKTTEEMLRFLRDEKLIETKYEFAGKWDNFFARFKRNPMKSAIDEVMSCSFIAILDY
ncbi:hypothetical protein OESDEN_15203 [Oesophagostomum dentatum]|uniref:Uncharacterized protein n=1 Tax=Oesophagostomum dentatum TaxID=61180 RepID=A0A0B1SMH0_OESDE|nr:hypothetical protein OESDEN_15203 [Oesophagostomum dentatum]